MQPICAMSIIFFQSLPSFVFFYSSSFSSYHYFSSNHSLPFLVLLLPIIPHLTVTIPQTFPLPFSIFISPSYFLSHLNVTLLSTIPLHFWLFFSLLFHTLTLYFLRPFHSLFLLFFSYLLFYLILLLLLF